MVRVLVTGGAGTVGQPVVRRLLRDPAGEVHTSRQADGEVHRHTTHDKHGPDVVVRP